MAKIQTYQRNVRWLLEQCRHYWVQMGLNLILGTVYVGAVLAFVWVMKWTVDIATGAAGGSIDLAIALLAGILAIEIALGFLQKWVRAILGIKARNRMQERVFHRLLLSEWLAVHRYHTGDVLNRVMEDAKTVVNLLTEDLPALVTTLFQLAGAFLFMYMMDSRLAIIVVCVSPLFILFSRLYVKRLRSLTHDVREMESQVQSSIQEGLQHSLVIKTLERVDYVTERLVGQHDSLRQKVVHKTWYGSISQLVLNVGFSMGYLVTFVWGVKHLQAGLITYGALTAFVQLVGQIQRPIRQLTGFVPVFISAFTAAERLMELEDIPLESSPDAQNGRAGLVTAAADVQFRHVSYQYDGSRKTVLKGFSYAFPSGSITAIVGETGAGKTTLIRLLLALIHPTEGSVMLGGERVTAAHRGAFGYVPQGNTLLSGTIRENLLMGNPKATETMLWEVLDVACADFVRQLKDGLETLCGEMGAGLSEGQAQRICIARALLRDCPILLFDESTSALDEHTERQVVERICDFAKGTTLIFVTHRPAVLEHCDQVLRL